jgi:malate dehydrogenase
MITIIGAGKVGSQSAFEIVKNHIDDVTLIDTYGEIARGEALDMMQAAPAVEFDGEIRGSNQYSDMEGSDLVILIAGSPRKPNQTRIDLMNGNARVVRSTVKEIARYAPDCKLMVVTNPMDIMTHVARMESGLPENCVFGMGNILDTNRFRSYIAEELGVSREDTTALVIGEHGDSMVPLVEYASVSGIPITDLLSKAQIDHIVQRTITSGADVIRLKGATTFAPASVIALTADAVVNGRNRVMSVSTCPGGKYSCKEISIGVPVVLGKNGVEKIIELKLSVESQQRFQKSIETIQAAIAKLEPAVIIA